MLVENCGIQGNFVGFKTLWSRGKTLFDFGITHERIVKQLQNQTKTEKNIVSLLSLRINKYIMNNRKTYRFPIIWLRSRT